MKSTNSFIKYVLEYYGSESLFYNPIVTEQLIKDAIVELALADHRFGGGDSYDREMVLAMITKIAKETVC